MTAAPRPRVTLIVAMRNEEGFIARCLHSILAQDYPADRLEIIVADGQSTDRSVPTARALLTGRPGAVVLDNPGRIQSAGWNLGIRVATGDLVGIVSAHAVLASDYVSAAVETLERTGATMVGGCMVAQGTTAFGEAVAAATSTRLGVGGASFHYASHEQDVDTVFMGVCRRETYDRLGGFDEELVNNQDDELSYRILDAGGRIVCNPAIRSTYFPRATWRGLARQYFRYGYWKVRVRQKHPTQMRPRHFVPMAFVAALVGLGGAAVALPLARVAWLGLVAAYATGIGATIAGRAGRHTGGVLWRMVLVFPTLHLCYGVGFWRGLVRFGWRTA